MKTSFRLLCAANVLSVGALLVLAGCTNVPMRQSTLALDVENAMTPSEMAAAGYEAPVPVHIVNPTHPWEMRRLGIPGDVDVCLVIDPTGKVIDAQVASSTDPVFEEPAISALKQWTFKPASLAGLAYTTRAVVPVRFTFED